MDFHGLLEASSTFSHVDDNRTSQETHLWVSTACYGYSFTLLFLL
jgi:hypothetical protein